MTLDFFLFLVATALGLWVFRYILSRWQHARNGRKLGCGPIPAYPINLLGTSTLKESLQADKEKLIPEMSERRVKYMSDKEGRLVSTFGLTSLNKRHIFTVDPKNIQAILATQFKDFELGKPRRNALHALLGTGIVSSTVLRQRYSSEVTDPLDQFTADGHEWSRSRALLRPQFTRDQISDLDLEERHVQNAMQALPVANNGWTATTDIQAIFFRLTIDSATEFLFGESVDTQLTSLRGQAVENFPYYFDKSQWYSAQRARFDSLHWLVNNKESRHSDQQVHAFVDHFVQRALEIVQEEKTKGDEEKSSNYVFLNALAGTTQDPIELRSQLLNILLAGRDTTASLLSWTVLLLARHPAVLKKLRQTVVDEFGTYSQPRNITFASLKSCQYLQQTLSEVLRLYPVVPLNRRTAVRDTTIPRGGGPDGLQPVYVRKGQSVMYSTHALQRRKDIWGEDADRFDPDRWTDRKVSWDYIPFNGGPRICIGQQFALTEAGYVMVRLLQRFDDIEDVYPDRRIRYGLTLTSCPADPTTVRLHEAADA